MVKGSQIQSDPRGLTFAHICIINVKTSFIFFFFIVNIDRLQSQTTDRVNTGKINTESIASPILTVCLDRVMSPNPRWVCPYLCPPLALLPHTEERRSQQGKEEREEGRSVPAGEWTNGWKDGCNGNKIIQSESVCTKHLEHQVKFWIY